MRHGYGPLPILGAGLSNEQFLCEMQCEPTSLPGAPALLFTKQATVQTDIGMCPLGHVCK